MEYFMFSKDFGAKTLNFRVFTPTNLIYKQFFKESLKVPKKAAKAA